MMKRAALNGQFFCAYFLEEAAEIVDKLSDVFQLALIKFFQIVDQLIELLRVIGGFVEEIPRGDVQVFADIKEGVHGWETFA